MENIEDDLILPITGESPSPIQKPNLKRLKKSLSTPEISDSITVCKDAIPPIRDSDVSEAFASKDLDKDGVFGDDFDPISEPNDVDGYKGSDDGLDPLFSIPDFDDGTRTLDLEGEGQEDEGCWKIGGIGSRIEKEKSAKKRLNLDDGSEEIPTKRRKKKNKTDDKLGEKAKESARGKKRSEKERMAQLEQMHAESQRLLRGV